MTEWLIECFQPSWMRLIFRMNLVPPSSGKANSLYQSTRVYVAEDCTANMVHRDNLQNPESRRFVFAKRSL